MKGSTRQIAVSKWRRSWRVSRRRPCRAWGRSAHARGCRRGDAIDAPDPPPLDRRHAHQHGFDLHAGIVVPAGGRGRLEWLCRYALRPPLGQDRLPLMPNGQAVRELRRRWTDELLGRLAVFDAAAA